MSAIAVWETMYSHKSVFETYGKFIRAVYLLGMPELCIVKEISDICSYLPLIYSNIFIVLRNSPAHAQTSPYIRLCTACKKVSVNTASDLNERFIDHNMARSIFCCSNSSSSPRVPIVGMSNPSFSSSSSGV
jgi:hypothetical protein